MMPVVATKATKLRDAIGADQAQELADEAAGARQADRGHGEQHEQQGISRHVVGEAAIAVDLAGVQPVVDHADAEEERARDEAVAQHHDQRPLHPLPVEGEDADGDEGHVRDRGISDQLLHVALHQRDERGVDDRDQAEAEDDPDELGRGLAGTSAARSGRSRSRRSSAARRRGSPSRRSAPGRGRRAARYGPATSAS